jgi:hypothetical protein
VRSHDTSDEASGMEAESGKTNTAYGDRSLAEKNTAKELLFGMHGARSLVGV